ncbi:Metallo-hydrolase/oxidoreductase [Neoconidiobolus thromboides FSU 785]|nr:Metallo-hydrolase/oxidoreductase [Neoconidiobolus thromboides FSU 785]
MSTITVMPLGAGQDVGKSCILVKAGGKTIMLDCGIHTGLYDHRKYPDFSLISKTGNYGEHIDCILVTHFHIDHCGALPHFTEQLGYNGQIIMSHPTKIICPLLLEDSRRVLANKGLNDVYTSEQIAACLKKVVTIDVHQTIEIAPDFEVTAYYAGHVVGAVMFHIKIGNKSIVYTGDYNMTPDRHLGSAWIEKLRPDVLITESTYGTMVRESKRTREKSFLKNIYYCVSQGGKVLVPVSALGTPQELFILIETYWERMGLVNVPVYFQSVLTMKGNDYYKLFINWTNQKIKDTFMEHNMFDFKYIKEYRREYVDLPGPAVFFATPSNMGFGGSLEIFKKLCHDQNNLVIMPGYCNPGTVGAKVLTGAKVIDDGQGGQIEVNLQVKKLSFTAHADSKGLMQMISHLEPKNVILVHGDKKTMHSLKLRVEEELNIPCYEPANGTEVVLKNSENIPIQISSKVIEEAHQKAYNVSKLKSMSTVDQFDDYLQINEFKPNPEIEVEGVLVYGNNKDIKLMTQEEARLKETPIELGQELGCIVNSYLELPLAIEREKYYKDYNLESSFKRSLNLIAFLLKSNQSIKHIVDIRSDSIIVDSLTINIVSEDLIEQGNPCLMTKVKLTYVYVIDNTAPCKRALNEIQKFIVKD